MTEPSFTTMDAVYAPGSPPLDFQFHNSAKLIRSGKPIRIEVHYTPNGKATTDQTRIADTVLSAKFDFQWQLGYEVEEPIKIPKGTKMIVIAHHDNSANNRLNPAPDKEVRWGELTSDEMMLPWFAVVVKQDAEPTMIASYRAGATTDEEAPLPKSHLPTPPFASNGSPFGVIPSLIKLDKIK